MGAWGFEEGSGSQTADASGTGHTGTISGAALTTTTGGRYGRGLSFDGTNDWVTVADSAALYLTTGMTLEAWVRPTSTKGWRTAIFKERRGGGVYALYAMSNAGRPRGSVHVAGDRDVRGTSALPANQWTHLAVTHDGANLRLYVNGVLVATRPQTGAITASTGVLQFGGNGVGREFFAGTIDEVPHLRRRPSARPRFRHGYADRARHLIRQP